MKHLLLLLSFLSLALSASSQSFLSRLLTPKSSLHADTIGDLPPQVEGTSSLFFLDGQYWTCNDHGQLTLYALDTTTAAIVDSITLAPYIYDMEEVSQDDDYLYFGDMGDNNGVRNDLRVLRLAKTDFAMRNFVFDTICFSYPDRNDTNARNFDCEAFVVTDTALIFFTKQWLDNACGCYSVPKQPGRWQARYLFTLPTDGMVTGASLDHDRHQLVLCGYTSLCSPFIYVAYGFDGIAFDGGVQRRLPLSLGFGCQTEGIATYDGLNYYLTCEKLDYYGITHPAQLFRLDLSSVLNTPESIGTPANHGQLIVYPNPTHGPLYIPSNQLERIEVLDSRGRAVLVSNNTDNVDLSSLPPSCYLLCMRLKNGDAETIRVVKK